MFSDDALLTLRRNGDELVGVIGDGLFLNPRGLRTPLGTIRFQRAEGARAEGTGAGPPPYEKRDTSGR